MRPLSSEVISNQAKVGSSANISPKCNIPINIQPKNFVYNPNVPALPLEVINANFQKIFDGGLHPKQSGHSIRREMTELRIS